MCFIILKLNGKEYFIFRSSTVVCCRLDWFALKPPHSACNHSFRFDSIPDVSVVVASSHLNSHWIHVWMSVSSMYFPDFFSRLIIFGGPITACTYFCVNTNHIAVEYVFIHLLHEPATPRASTLRAPGGMIHTVFLNTIAACGARTPWTQQLCSLHLCTSGTQHSTY